MLPLRVENPKPVGWKPYITYALIAINILLFFWEIAETHQVWEFTNKQAEDLLLNYGTVPAIITSGLAEHDYGVISTIFSSMFLHAGVIHIGGNMLFLWIFGNDIEYKFGRGKFLGLYLFWGVMAGFFHILSDPSSSLPAIGASGAISGVLGAYLVLFPNAKVMTLMLFGFFTRITRISAKWYLPFWFIFQNVLPVLIGSSGSGVAFFAHIGGFIVGLLSGLIYKKTHSSEFTYGTRYGWKGNNRWGT